MFLLKVSTLSTIGSVGAESVIVFKDYHSTTLTVYTSLSKTERKTDLSNN